MKKEYTFIYLFIDSANIYSMLPDTIIVNMLPSYKLFIVDSLERHTNFVIIIQCNRNYYYIVTYKKNRE